MCRCTGGGPTPQLSRMHALLTKPCCHQLPVHVAQATQLARFQLAVDPALHMLCLLMLLLMLLLLLPPLPRVLSATSVACDKTAPAPWCQGFDTCMASPSLGQAFSCYRIDNGVATLMPQGAHSCA